MEEYDLNESFKRALLNQNKQEEKKKHLSEQSSDIGEKINEQIMR